MGLKTTVTIVVCLWCIFTVALIAYVCSVTWIRMTESRRARFYFGEYAHEHGLEEKIEEWWTRAGYSLLWKFVYDWTSFEYNAMLLTALAKKDHEGLSTCKNLQISKDDMGDVIDEQNFCLGYVNSTLMKTVVEKGIELCNEHSKGVVEEVLIIGKEKSEFVKRDVECISYVFGSVSSFTHADRIAQCVSDNKAPWNCARKFCLRWLSADK